MKRPLTRQPREGKQQTDQRRARHQPDGADLEIEKENAAGRMKQAPATNNPLQPRPVTTSSCSIAMCAVGPPNAVNPSLVNRAASSDNDAGFCSVSKNVFLFWPVPSLLSPACQ